jgi:hypothetical protein
VFGAYCSHFVPKFVRSIRDLVDRKNARLLPNGKRSASSRLSNFIEISRSGVFVGESASCDETRRANFSSLSGFFWQFIGFCRDCRYIFVTGELRVTTERSRRTACRPSTGPCAHQLPSLGGHFDCSRQHGDQAGLQHRPRFFALPDSDKGPRLLKRSSPSATFPHDRLVCNANDPLDSTFRGGSSGAK